MVNGNEKVAIKNNLSKIKQSMINSILDDSIANKEDVNVELLKVVNNVSDDVLVANALTFISDDQNFLGVLLSYIEESSDSDKLPW